MTARGLVPLHFVALAMCTGFAAIAAAVPVVQRAHGASARDVALAGVATSLGTVVGAVWAGRRTITRALLLWALVLLAVSAVALQLATNDLRPGWRLLDGVSLGVAIVACETLLLQSTSPSARARTLALYTLATAAGWAIGPLLAALTPSSSGPAGFVVAGAAALLAIVIATQHRPAPIDAPPETMASPEPRSTLWRRNLAPCATTLHFGAFQAALLVVLPLHILQQGRDGRVAMVAVAMFALGMLCLTLANTSRAARLGPAPVMQGLCVLGGAAVVGVGALPSTTATVAALSFVSGATLATLSPLSLLWLVQHNTPATLGAANALYNAHYAVGLALGPVVIAAVVDVVSPAALLVVMGAAWVAHAVLLALTAPPAASSPVTFGVRS